MLGKLNKLKDELSKLNDIKKQFSDVDMSDPQAMLESFGIDYEALEDSFTHKGFEPKEIEFSYNSINPEPKYHYDSDSGFDLRANERLVLGPLERALVSTGLHIDVPTRCEVQVRPKSGITLKKGITVLNTPGTVDRGYNGEIIVILVNLSNQPFTIKNGDRIAQAVISPVISGRWCKLTKKNTLSNTNRGDGGFGSTGIE